MTEQSKIQNRKPQGDFAERAGADGQGDSVGVSREAKRATFDESSP
jgi:hypothetical protein